MNWLRPGRQATSHTGFPLREQIPAFLKRLERLALPRLVVARQIVSSYDSA